MRAINMNRLIHICRLKNIHSKTKGERASVPGTITIEASFAIPFFMFAFMCLIYFMEIQNIRLNIMNAAQNAAKSIAVDTAVVPVLNTVKLKNCIVENIGEERIERSMIDGGTSSIKCWKSYILPQNGEMHIKVEYKIKIPVPFFMNLSATLKEEFIMHGWNGYNITSDSEEDEDIVYVTQDGVVYHEDYECSYLKLSVEYVPAGSVKNIRNEYGAKYKQCDKCSFGSSVSGVYVTKFGTKYHSSIQCSGLKRTIYAVKRSETGWKGRCSRCCN